MTNPTANTLQKLIERLDQLETHLLNNHQLRELHHHLATRDADRHDHHRLEAAIWLLIANRPTDAQRLLDRPSPPAQALIIGNRKAQP